MRAQILAMLMVLIGDDDSVSGAATEMILDTVIDKVCTDINQDNIPQRLYRVIAEMAYDARALYAISKGKGAGEVAGSISTISDNGQSVGYRESAYASVLGVVTESFLKNYDAQLAAYRKPRW